MYRNFCTLIACVLVMTSAFAQTTDSTITNTEQPVEYVIELINNNIIQGVVVSDDGREIGIKTTDRGLVFIPKYEIKTMTLAADLPVILGNKVYSNPHPGRYFYSPSGLSMKQGDAYVQAIYYVVYQAQYAITDHWSIGATTSIILSPILLNFKYTHELGTKENLHFVTGLQGGTISPWNSDDLLGVAYAGLTFGNPEHNLTLNAGSLRMRSMTQEWNGNTNKMDDVIVRQNSPALSISVNQRISSTACLMAEFWYVIGDNNDIFVGGPGIRTYRGKKNTIDVAVLAASVSGNMSGLIPLVSWTQRIMEW